MQHSKLYLHNMKRKEMERHDMILHSKGGHYATQYDKLTTPTQHETKRHGKTLYSMGGHNITQHDKTYHDQDMTLSDIK